jgi:AcrR family transcriptional regulator
MFGPSLGSVRDSLQISRRIGNLSLTGWTVDDRLHPVVRLVVGRGSERREAALREVLDAAWALMEREGVAALSLRQTAGALGIRPQSLAHYFPNKAALLDALFRDGFTDLGARLARVGSSDEPVERLVAAVQALLEFCVASPARYHLMLQRTVPGFTPTAISHEVALGALGSLLERLRAAGVTESADVDVFRGLVNGLAAEQIANDPGGRRFISRAEYAVRVFLAGIKAPSIEDR